MFLSALRSFLRIRPSLFALRSSSLVSRQSSLALPLSLVALCTSLVTLSAQDSPAPEEIPPWGRLIRTPIFLEASQRIVDTLPLPNPKPRWSFPDSEASQLPQMLVGAGLPAAMAGSLTLPDRTVRSDGWIHLFPSPQDILSLDPAVRSALHALLARHDINEFYHSPVFILTDTVEEWYRTSRLRPELIQLIARLACRRGTVWTFSDIPLLLSQAMGEEEARLIYKTFTRSRAYLVRLDITPGTQSSVIKDYWSVGGSSFRTKDLDPLIESLQATGEQIRLDLGHILPPLARKLLFTYPAPEHAAEGILPDCHWTSLNFFNYDSHSYLLDSGLATSKVLRDYAPVDSPYQYGDILFFLDLQNGDAFHSCVYLAEDLVFTKNGRNALAPWIVSTIEDVTAIYLSTQNGRLQAYRRTAPSR